MMDYIVFGRATPSPSFYAMLEKMPPEEAARLRAFVEAPNAFTEIMNQARALQVMNEQGMEIGFAAAAESDARIARERKEEEEIAADLRMTLGKIHGLVRRLKELRARA